MIAIPSRGRALGRDRTDRWSDALRGAAVAVVLVGMVGSVLLAQGWRSTVDRQRNERLDRTAASRTVTISSALANYGNALQAARSLWLVSKEVSRDDFSVFARSLDLETRYPGLQNISWREVVRDADAAEFVATARREGESRFAIRPPGRRPVYYVTRYTYPRTAYSSRLGLDARATPSILASLELARDTDRTSISGQTTLVDDLWMPVAQRPVAYELFMPVYETDRPLESDAERRKRFRGWASGQFRAGDFLAATLRTTLLTTGVELHDPQVGRASLVASFPAGFRAAGPYVRTERFSFGDRTFVLRYAPRAGNPILTERTIPAALVLGMGVTASILLGALLWLLGQLGALYREVGRLARTDSLTGVANRRAWDEQLPRELARAARSGQPLCLALLDLDHFKDYNDQHGHQAGDRLLKAAAAAWQGKLRKTDLLARYGGEEFAVLLPDCTLDQGLEIAERLRTSHPEGTCSVGLAGWDGREDAAGLVARADRALYVAKAGGRNRCCVDRAAAPAAPTPTS